MSSLDLTPSEAADLPQGRIFTYYTNSLFPNSPQTVFTVQGSAAFYINYLSFTAFSVIPDAVALYFATDNVPVMLLTSTQTSAQVFFPSPVVCQFAAIVGNLGSMSQPVAFLVTYGGIVFG